MPLRLNPHTAAMTVLLAVLTSLGPLSTDMYLPSLPHIGAALGAGASQTQLTLSVFLVGFALGQVFYGPVSDRFGRKPVLLAGLVIYTLATWFCYRAASIETLIAARFCQAIGACAGVVLARAMVRDLYEGAQAARLMSLMGALMGAVPAVAPIFGGMLQLSYGWRANFAAVIGVSLVICAVVALSMPETNTRKRDEPLSFRSLFVSFGVLIAHSGFRANVVAASLCYGGLFAFISGSSFVFQEHYAMGPVGFGLVFAFAVLGYIAGTLAGARMTTRRGIVPTQFAGAILLAAGGMAMLALVLLVPPHFVSVLAPMVLYMAGVGLALPQSMAAAISPFPERAGAASSLLGFIQMTSGALVGILVGHNLTAGPLVLAISIAGLGIACLAVVMAIRSAAARAGSH